MVVIRRKWQWLDWLFYGLYAAWFVFGTLIFLFRPDVINGSIPLPILLVWAALCFGAPLLFWHPGYINKSMFPLAVLLTTGSLQLYLSYNSHKMIGILVFPILIIGYMANRYNIWWTFPIFVVGFPTTLYFLTDEPYALSSALDQLLGSAIFFGIGFSSNRNLESYNSTRGLLEENIKQYELIREQNRVLEQYANHVEKLTLLEERNRLAQELHDTVGHTFTSVIMGMDAVSLLIESAPEKAKARLDVLREVTRKGLDEVRRSIHQIAPMDDDDSLQQQLSHVANEFAVHTGTQVKIRNTGKESTPPKPVKLALIRCLQEALTNAKRHGSANRIDILLDITEERIGLIVEDNGTGAARLQAGFGLTGMRERIEALQGTFRIESEPGHGTRLTCEIPLNTPVK